MGPGSGVPEVLLRSYARLAHPIFPLRLLLWSLFPKFGGSTERLRRRSLGRTRWLEGLFVMGGGPERDSLARRVYPDTERNTRAHQSEASAGRRGRETEGGGERGPLHTHLRNSHLGRPAASHATDPSAPVFADAEFGSARI